MAQQTPAQAVLDTLCGDWWGKFYNAENVEEAQAALRVAQFFDYVSCDCAPEPTEEEKRIRAQWEDYLPGTGEKEPPYAMCTEDCAIFIIF